MAARDNTKGVYLTIEFDAPFLLEDSANKQWLEGLSLTHDRGRLCSIEGSTEDFKRSLGVIESLGCNQDLISHLKYARSEGAKWIIFY